MAQGDADVKAIYSYLFFVNSTQRFLVGSVQIKSQQNQKLPKKKFQFKGEKH